MFAAVSVWSLLIAARLVYLQTYGHAGMKQVALDQQEKDVDLPAPRGMLQDRDGRILAVSVKTESLGVIPGRIAEPGKAADLLTRLVAGLDRAELAAKITSAAQAKRRFLPIKLHLAQEEAAAIRAHLAADAREHARNPEKRIAWIDLRPTSRRQYTAGTLAAHILGSVSLDRREREAGREGVERSLEAELSGIPGRARMLTDVKRRGIDTLELQPPVAGKTVALTISAPLQHFVEARLARGVAETGAVTGAATVLDPATGQVLAMASYPSFDPNATPKFNPDPAKAKSDPERTRRVNLAVSGSNEAGSVAKLFTFAAALKYTRLSPETWINCGNGTYRVSDTQEIHDSHAFGGLRMKEVLWQSSNVGTINIANEVVRSVGAAKFREFLTSLGFGKRTGIELPDESRGILRANWRKHSHVHHAIGYEYSSTTLQIAQAVGVIANNGVRIAPTLVLWKQAPGGQREYPPPPQGERVISAGQAIDLRAMAEGVILHGTGKAAKIEGYLSGGKTGTAKRLENGHYTSTYNSSFAGFAPLKQPRVVVVVTLHRTHALAASTAAPVYRDIAEAALRHLGVRPDIEPNPDRILARAPSADEEAAPETAAQAPQPQPPPAEVHTIGPAVPDWKGRNKKQIAELALAMGIPVEMSGSGVVVRQHPPPGSALLAGAVVRLHFER